jgi:transposase
MAGEFWLSDGQWATIEPLLPKNQSGAHRVDDQRRRACAEVSLSLAGLPRALWAADHDL